MRAVLDACVLVPASTRTILLGAAAEGLFVPVWSHVIIAEWMHAAARVGGPAGMAAAQAAHREAVAAFPAALVDPGTAARDLPHLPDPDDAHVLAAAVVGCADVVVTFNLSDFPRRPLAALGITPRDPDGLLWELWSHAPVPVARAVQAARQALPGQVDDTGHGARPVRAFLRRAGLPRLGRAMDPSLSHPPPHPRSSAPRS